MNFCVIWRWIFPVPNTCFYARRAHRSEILSVAGLFDDHNLIVFKRFLSFPPLWRELRYFLPFVILVWPTRPPSANLGTMMIGRELHNGEKRSFPSLDTGCICCCEKAKRNIVGDHYFDSQFLLQGISSIRAMTQKKVPAEIQFFLPVNLQWATCFVPAIQALYTSEIEM